MGITPEQFGLIVSSYTFAAGAAGLVASAIIDRFGRRTMFMLLYSGFLIGTLLCAFAPDYYSLVAARVLTGSFGGILGGMAMAIIGDVFPENRRGHATGSLMIGFSLAAVAGVPFGLYLGTNHGWHTPFIALVCGGLPALLLAPFALPPLKGHIGKRHAHPLASIASVFSEPNHLRAFALIIALMVGSFTVFPYLSDYLVKNVGMTEHELPWVYIAGGALTLFTSPIIGRLADRFGKRQVFQLVAPGSAVLLLAITHLPAVHMAVAVALFGALMVVNSGRMIPAMAMITSSVSPQQRGAFMSANSSVQHIAAGIGASIGGKMISELPNGQLDHFGRVGWVAAAATLAGVWLAGRLRVADTEIVSAESISLAAAAEAMADAGEPIADCAEVSG
jgi:predicted MFS family arabinose efflux permease